MAAAVEFVPVDDVAIAPIRPAPRQAHDFVREQAARGRDMDFAGDEAAEAVPIEPRRRGGAGGEPIERSEEHTSELQSLMRISYAVFCLKKKNRCTHTSTFTNRQYKPSIYRIE